MSGRKDNWDISGGRQSSKPARRTARLTNGIRFFAAFSLPDRVGWLSYPSPLG
jgi:hypothetical protein